MSFAQRIQVISKMEPEHKSGLKGVRRPKCSSSELDRSVDLADFVGVHLKRHVLWKWKSAWYHELLDDPGRSRQ